MPGPIAREEFVSMLTERFPAVAADIGECERGMVHLEMHALARATQRAISDEDRAAVRNYFSFVGEVFRLGTPDVRNAVGVSFLEYLGWDGRHAGRIGARQKLSPQLQIALRDLEEYNAELRRRK